MIRNGVLYRDTAADRQDLVVYEDGSFEVVEESEITAQELLDKGAWQVLSFGPGLVEDGEMAEFMQSLGTVTAYNLDGGGSSTMYFNGELVNNPTTSGRSIKERSVSDIVYIGY